MKEKEAEVFDITVTVNPFFPHTHHMYEKMKNRSLNSSYYEKNYHIQEIVTLILTKKMKCFQSEVYFSISHLLCFLNLSYKFSTLFLSLMTQLA